MSTVSIHQNAHVDKIGLGTSGKAPVAPPPTNRGVQRTQNVPEGEKGPGGLPIGEVVLDWLEGTFLDRPTDDALDIVIDLFGAIHDRGMGFLGYEHSGRILAGRGIVAWSTAYPENGVHVSLPSQALGELGRSCKLRDVRSFLRYLLALGFKPSRVDLSLDDTSGLLSFGEMWQAVQDRHYTSRWRFWRHYEDSNGGETIYFGHPSSETRLRIYDKAAEQGVAGPWVRCEMQLRDTRGQLATQRLVDDGPEFVPGMLRGYLEFKDASDGDSNRRRWPAAGWWVTFLHGACKVRIGLPAPTRTLAGLRDWLERQVAPTLALVDLAEGGALDWLVALVDRGRTRLTDTHLALLNDPPGEMTWPEGDATTEC